MKIRIGHGYDVHRLAQGRPLILGGTQVPYEKGLLGHSDADVLVHAVCDALLGALAMGDIGRHFPDTDESFRGADSMLLLARCVDWMRAQGLALGNLDATVVAQAPKLAGYIPAMRENLAEVFGCELSQVNVKATTEEGMGFTGEGLGIAAHCVLVLTD